MDSSRIQNIRNSLDLSKNQYTANSLTSHRKNNSYNVWFIKSLISPIFRTTIDFKAKNNPRWNERIKGRGGEGRKKKEYRRMAIDVRINRGHKFVRECLLIFAETLSGVDLIRFPGKTMVIRGDWWGTVRNTERFNISRGGWRSDDIEEF